MSHSVTGEVTTIQRVEAGYGDNAVAVGINVSVRIVVPYVYLDEYNEGKPVNRTYHTNVVMFYPTSEMPPSVGETVTVSLEVTE